MLAALLGGLVSLYDVEGGVIFLADEDGLVDAPGGGHGRAASPRACTLPSGSRSARALWGARRSSAGRSSSTGSGTSEPTHGQNVDLRSDGRRRASWWASICLTTRPSRLTGRSELLLLQAFSNRVGEILVGANSDEGPLMDSLERFRTAWSAASGAS